MKIDQYHIQEVLQLLDDKKDIEAYDLLEVEIKKALINYKKSRLSQNSFCMLVSTLYQKFNFIQSDRYVPVWIRDFLNESIDVCVSENTLNLQRLEDIVIKREI